MVINWGSKSAWLNVLFVLAAALALALSTQGLVPPAWTVYIVFAQGFVNIVLHAVETGPPAGP